MFVPESVIIDLNLFNYDPLNKCLRGNEELHYRFKRPINELFEEEKPLIIPFNTIPFDTARYELRKVNKYGLIDFLGYRYSVSPKYVGQHVSIKIMANELEILSKDLSERITSHSRLFKKGGESINYIDFIDMIKVRPTALKYSGIYSLLPESWQGYLESLDKETLKGAFNILKLILLEEELDYADKVLRETMKHDSISPEAILLIYKRLKENLGDYEDKIYLPPGLPSYGIDISQYDMFMKGVVRWGKKSVNLKRV